MLSKRLAFVVLGMALFSLIVVSNLTAMSVLFKSTLTIIVAGSLFVIECLVVLLFHYFHHQKQQEPAASVTRCVTAFYGVLVTLSMGTVAVLAARESASVATLLPVLQWIYWMLFAALMVIAVLLVRATLDDDEEEQSSAKKTDKGAKPIIYGKAGYST